MSKNRIEIHLSDEEVKQLDAIAKKEGRSRKNFCETQVRKILTDMPVLAAKAVRQKKQK